MTPEDTRREVRPMDLVKGLKVYGSNGDGAACLFMSREWLFSIAYN